MLKQLLKLVNTRHQYGTKARQHDNRQLITIILLNDIRPVNI